MTQLTNTAKAILHLVRMELEKNSILLMSMRDGEITNTDIQNSRLQINQNSNLSNFISLILSQQETTL